MRSLVQRGAELAGTRTELRHINHKSNTYTWYSDGSICVAPTVMRFPSADIYFGFNSNRSGIQDNSTEIIEPNCHCGTPTHLVFVIHGIGASPFIFLFRCYFDAQVSATRSLVCTHDKQTLNFCDPHIS